MNAHERAMLPDWLCWSQRDQCWLIHVWDSVAPDSRSMWVKLTEEQSKVIFTGLENPNTGKDQS